MTKPTLEELLASARADEPTAGQLQQLEHKLAPLLPSGGGGGGGAGGAGGATGGGVALKWIVASIVAVGGAVAIQRVVSHRASSPPSAPAVEPRVVEAPPPIADAAPAVTVVPPAPAAPPPHPSHASGDTLVAETALLDRARAAIQHGDAAAALASCDAHAKTYAHGVLREERERIAIEALVALGRRDDAAARTQRFDRAFPNSVQSERLHALVRAR